MTLYAFYTRREFDAQEEAEALGLTCYVPRRVDLIRQGKRRRPDPVIRPFLPGYVFVDTDAEGWHMLQSSKHFKTWFGIGPAEARRVHAFIDQVEADLWMCKFGEAASERNDLAVRLQGLQNKTGDKND